MAKYPNPLAQVSYHVAKGVHKNTAIMNFRIVKNDMLSGLSMVKVFHRNILILSVDIVDDWLVKNNQFNAGDLRVYIPAVSLYNAKNEVRTDDPEIKINGASASLSDLRPWNNVTGCIKVGVNSDTMTWNGSDYQIIKVEPKDFWNNSPGKFRIYMRKI